MSLQVKVLLFHNFPFRPYSSSSSSWFSPPCSTTLWSFGTNYSLSSTSSSLNNSVLGQNSLKASNFWPQVTNSTTCSGPPSPAPPLSHNLLCLYLLGLIIFLHQSEHKSILGHPTCPILCGLKGQWYVGWPEDPEHLKVP